MTDIHATLRPFFTRVIAPFCAVLAVCAAESTPEWPQFRGPSGSGVARAGTAAPVEFGKDKGLEWSVPAGAGHASPVISGDRIFLTSADKAAKKLIIQCIDRKSGRTLWQHARAVNEFEPCHGISNAATATPATDGQLVFTYFSSYGLAAYDFDGKEIWTYPLPVAVNRMGFGSGTSPIVKEGLVLLDVHAGKDSHMLALHAGTGKVAWKAANPLFNEGWSTPLVWKEDGETLVGILNASRFTARRLKDGTEKWWLPGLPSQICATPVALGDLIVLTGTGVFGEKSNMNRPPEFAEMLKQYDANRDGAISLAEIPETLLAADRKSSGGAGNTSLRQFLGFSPEKKESYERADWEKMLKGFDEFLSTDFMSTRAMAVRTGGSGDVSKSAVLWSESKGVPEIPSPLVAEGRVYLVKSGGIAICRDLKTGKELFEERLGAPGGYYASPVCANGRIYAASDTGTMVVFEAGEKLKVLARNALGEPIRATPAIADGHIYVRTDKNLYSFKSTAL